MVVLFTSMNDKAKVSTGIGLRFRLVFIASLMVCLLWYFRSYSTIQVPEGCFEMSPLIEPGQSVYLYSRSHVLEYKKGDLVWYRYGVDDRWRWAWVLGRGGEVFSIVEGQLLEGGEPLPQKIKGLPKTLNRSFAPVPSGHFFLVHGDQSVDVEDSLLLGPFDPNELEVKGKVFFLL